MLRRAPLGFCSRGGGQIGESGPPDVDLSSVGVPCEQTRAVMPSRARSWSPSRLAAPSSDTSTASSRSSTVRLSPSTYRATNENTRPSHVVACDVEAVGELRVASVVADCAQRGLDQRVSRREELNGFVTSRLLRGDRHVPIERCARDLSSEQIAESTRDGNPDGVVARVGDQATVIPPVERGLQQRF